MSSEERRKECIWMDGWSSGKFRRWNLIEQEVVMLSSINFVCLICLWKSREITFPNRKNAKKWMKFRSSVVNSSTLNLWVWLKSKALGSPVEYLSGNAEENIANVSLLLFLLFYEVNRRIDLIYCNNSCGITIRIHSTYLVLMTTCTIIVKLTLLLHHLLLFYS